MTRVPLVSDSATFSAASRQLEQGMNRVSPSFHSPAWRSKVRGVEATVKEATAAPEGVKRSSGSAVRFPMIVMMVSPAMMVRAFLDVVGRLEEVVDGGLVAVVRVGELFEGAVVVLTGTATASVVLDAGLPELPALSAAKGGDLFVGGGDPASVDIAEAGCPLGIGRVVVGACCVVAGCAVAAWSVLAWTHD